jgi:hypothetical protein
VDPAWVTAAIAFATVAVACIAWSCRSAWKWFNRISDFLEDWNGRPETRSHKRVPGAMERLARLEDSSTEQTRRIDDQDNVLDAIKHEVTLNSGGSLKDTVSQILRTINNQNGS